MGLRLQFIMPAMALLLGAVVGWQLDLLELGLIAGTLGAGVVGFALAAHAKRRLNAIAALVSGERDSSSPTPETPRTRDEIDKARASVFRAIEIERARVQREREEAGRQVRLLDRLSDGVMLVDGDGEVIYANVAAASLVGGRNPIGRSFIAAVRDHELSDALFNCMRTGVEHRGSLEVPGDDRVVDAVIARVTLSPPEALVLMRDVTELAKLQTLRRDFVANVSHELRTPLSTIKILTETLLDLRSETPDERNFLQKIDAEVDSLTELVGDLLQLTQLESGRAPLTLGAVRSSTLLDEVAGRMLPIAERQRVQLDVDAASGDFEFVADERRMKQVLINLVHNAIVHTPAGGLVRLSSRRDESQVFFSVTDSGVGISPAELERIWERFYKVDRSRAHPGTGLGLAIVKHVVQAHGGSVSASSRLGHGSTFELSIPTSPRRSRRAATA